MCNLYSVTSSRQAIMDLARAMRGPGPETNFPPLPGVFPTIPRRSCAMRRDLEDPDLGFLDQAAPRPSPWSRIKTLGAVRKDMNIAPASDHFARPVVVLTGFGMPTAVSTAMEAYALLADWPPAQRDAAHAFAAKACLAAARGEVEADTARGMFAAWAERRGILAPDVAAFSRSRGNRSRGAG